MSTSRTEASYFSVRKGTLAQTIQATPLLQLDVDEAGNLLGIERIGGALDDTDLLRIVEVFTPVVVAARAYLAFQRTVVVPGIDSIPHEFIRLAAAVDPLDGAS